MEHLPGCSEPTLAELYPDEKKPDDMSDEAWYEIRVSLCVVGCPILERRRKRYVEIARKRGFI
jgi:hypothetical protein